MNTPTTRLINRAAVRDKTMAVLASKRPHLAGKLTRVSSGFYLKAQAAVSAFIEHHVETMPTSGHTIR